MAIYESNGSETAEDILEDIESEESDIEARPSRWRRPRTATGGGLFQPRPATSTYVTQVQLQTALARVSGQIKTNSTAVETLTSRVNALNDTVKKEQGTRRKDTDGVRRDLRQMRDMTMLLPLISQPSSITLSGDVGTTNLKAGTKVLVDTGDTMSLLLPMLLFGGLGSSSSASTGGTAGSSDGGSDNTMMMMAMVLALGRK